MQVRDFLSTSRRDLIKKQKKLQKASLRYESESDLNVFNEQLQSNASALSQLSLAPQHLGFEPIVKELLGNTEFIQLLSIITMIFYIVAGVQYWAPTYLQTVMLQDKQVTNPYIAITSLTSPLSGLLAGGLTTTYYGGYTT